MEGMGDWSNGVLEKWNIGVMEWWGIGEMAEH